MSTLKIERFIGNGAYGKVYLGTWEGRKAAIKQVMVSEDEAHHIAAIQHEMDILKLLVDRHIIQFYGTTYHEDRLVLVMDYAEGGSLQSAIDGKRLADWGIKERIAQEIVRGLNYIHHKGVLHRDLKSMNVLLTRTLEVKLCDFGLATIKTRSASRSTSTLKGTFRWMAPELFGDKPKYSTKSDMYALAMVMWEMAADCTAPFQVQADNFLVALLIREGKREVLPNDTPPEYRMWVERCWNQDPEKRPEASDMVRDDEPSVADETRSNATTLSLSLDASGTTFAGLSIGSSSSSSNNYSMASTVHGSTSQPPSGSIGTLLHKAEGGSVEAQTTVAAMYQKGNGVKQSYTEALKWYHRAAPESPEAQYQLGELFLHGRGGVEKNYRLAVHWMRQAAERGHPRAQSGLGWMYQRSVGVDRDDGEAVTWYKKSAEQGYARAQTRLGVMYQYALGTDQDYGQAVVWYGKAAEQGDALAQYNLGMMYKNGHGVGQDLQQAKKWFQKSAEQGNGDAAKQLEKT